MKDPTQVIIRPILTEKSTFLQRLNQFTFEVARDASKIEIRTAIESLGKCSVLSVNTLLVKGKLRRQRNRVGRTPTWKKAIVTLREGQSMGGVLGQAYEAP